MSIKSDKWIKEMSIKHKMIDPFLETQIKENVISYGLSSYGYDIRIADEFKILNLTAIDKNKIIEPKKIEPELFTDFKGKECIIPPNSFILARSIEYFRIPRNILTLCFGKSTYARVGIIVNITPLEPEWEGYVTISICNTAPVKTKIYANEGIAQVVFLESDEICKISYKDKKGKYQSQNKITLPQIISGNKK